ncbi:hypothetical protein ACIP5Y_07255 [Nocardia sp. NPDC088792]|uniref:hypothetical protein n=1 Tax=Nocardia sp. NPDC088792 TaxID=3364332 RepID=UPI00382857A2
MTDPDHGAKIFRQAWIDGVTRHYPGDPKPSYVSPWDDMPDWEKASAAAVYEQVAGFVTLTDGAACQLTREQKGRFIAICWIGQVRKHIADPKPGYVADWDQIAPWQQQTDIEIFESIERSMESAPATR